MIDEKCVKSVGTIGLASSKGKSEKYKMQSPEEILKELGIKVDKNEHSEKDYHKLVNFLAKNQDIFARSLVDLPGANFVLHKIDTGNAPPFRQRMYRATPDAKREIARQTAEMLKMGIKKKPTQSTSVRCSK